MTKQIFIIKNNKTLFDETDLPFEIPLYQRPFAWKDEEINALIEDINDFNKISEETDEILSDENYYIGTLVVFRNETSNSNFYEIIDGQQRLTALYLLLSYLGYSLKPTLRFARRTKSNNAIKNIKEIIKNYKEKQTAINLELVMSDDLQESIKQGIHIIHSKFVSENINIEKFKKQLEKVILFRVEVPTGTDLNRYFEIMNTRGEQLEQQDILKAKLMSSLNNRETEVFAKIWNACSEMNGYVQMHFDTDSRRNIFGRRWDDSYPNFNTKELFNSELKTILSNNSGEPKKLEEIIVPSFKVSEEVIKDKDNNRIRFESIIDFPHFLLHCLKIYISENNVVHIKNSKEPLVNSLLDDKKLIKCFDNVLKFGSINGKVIDKKDFSKEFIVLLLKCRFLFDKYIIKREYINEKKDGDWSLKEFHVSCQDGKNNLRPYFTKTAFPGQKEKDRDFCDENLMIQAAMRVSFTSPKIMHWITYLLSWLYEGNNLKNYNNIAENYVRKNILTEFFVQDNYARLGVKTPHIVFNYLDYLIWKANQKKYEWKVDNKNAFTFEFRTSVEHWYPQHPNEKEGIFAWEDVDRFGNLCIIQRNINSKFSNQSPKAKKDDNTNEITKGSLKLRKMASIISNCSNDDWKNSECEKHELKMLEILKNDCFSYSHLWNLICDDLRKEYTFENCKINSYDVLAKKFKTEEFVYIRNCEDHFEIGFVKHGGYNTNEKYKLKLRNKLDGLNFKKQIFKTNSAIDIYRNKWIYRTFTLKEVSYSLIYTSISSMLKELLS